MKIRPHSKNLIYIAISLPVIAVLAALVIFPNLLNRGLPGSFEYIRRGEALLEKGNHIDAIKYYEKAHASSPESDVIRRELVYAYSGYAVKMAESEKYEPGIQYLTKAYGLLQNTYTRQNLAHMYARRALFEAKRSDWARAQGDLDTAREIADDSAAVNRNLGISLFNDAVGEFKAGREDAAILLAKEAALVYQDSRIYEFLGDIYHKKIQLERAIFYLDKAVKLDPENVKLVEKREKMIKEAALSVNEKTSALPYFDLKYEKDLPVNALLAANILERAYFDAGRDLSYFPKARTVVFFYSEENFREIFKMQDMVRAFYDGNIRIPWPGAVTDEKELAGYLYHEYAHAIISAKTNNNCPVWLSEGIAVYEELKWTRPGIAINVPADISRVKDISIGALDRTFTDAGVNSDRLASAYILAYTAVEYMTDNWGLKGLDGVLDKISGGTHAVNAMDDEYLLSEREFDRRWSDFVAKRYLKKEEGK